MSTGFCMAQAVTISIQLASPLIASVCPELFNWLIEW